MRVLVGRGDWRPRHRIEGLRRYAFIGDSHAYGSGVAPDQTLPAHSERQMNEACGGWPVEAVNLGISGYNIWNSWLGFRHGPLVYDGVVLVLCSNDADLFGRTYHVRTGEPYPVKWEASHPFGEAVARCFDDMAAFGRDHGLPIAVCYFNAWDGAGQLRIGEILGGLCAARGIVYVDTFAHYQDRRFVREDLLVSAADFHPSAKAHEAVARHLAARLRREGWFGDDVASEMSAAPDRIVAAARAMVALDRYPPQAALAWAGRALEAKSRLARRSGLPPAGGFAEAAARAAETVSIARSRWHMIQRVRAFVAEVASGGQGISTALWRAEEALLRVEEVAFVLATGDWTRLAARLPEAEAPPVAAVAVATDDAHRILEAFRRDVRRAREALDGLRRLAAAPSIGWPHDGAVALADLDTLERSADRAEAACAVLQAGFGRAEAALRLAGPGLTGDEAALAAGRIALLVTQVHDDFAFLPRWAAVLERLGDAEPADFTTVEVTFSSPPIEGRAQCIMSIHAQYLAPDRLPFSDAGAFYADGTSMLVTLRFPTMYAGRLLLRPFHPTLPGQPTLEATLIKVEIHNRGDQRQQIDPGSFHRSASDRLVSPVVYPP